MKRQKRNASATASSCTMPCFVQTTKHPVTQQHHITRPLHTGQVATSTRHTRLQKTNKTIPMPLNNQTTNIKRKNTQKVKATKRKATHQRHHMEETEVLESDRPSSISDAFEQESLVSESDKSDCSDFAFGFNDMIHNHANSLAGNAAQFVEPVSIPTSKFIELVSPAE